MWVNKKVFESFEKQLIVLREQNERLLDRLMARDFEQLKTYTDTEVSSVRLPDELVDNEPFPGTMVDNETVSE